MEIVSDLTKSNLSKNQIEYIQKKQREYKLTDKKRRVPGHILFSFNLKTKEIKRASITNEVSFGLNGKSIMKTKTVIEPDCYYEQALNDKLKGLKDEALNYALSEFDKRKHGLEATVKIWKYFALIFIITTIILTIRLFIL